MKSKPGTSSTPSAFSCSTTLPRLLRWISGRVVASNDRKAASVYSRNAFPAASRPAANRTRRLKKHCLVEIPHQTSKLLHKTPLFYLSQPHMSRRTQRPFSCHLRITCGTERDLDLLRYMSNQLMLLPLQCKRHSM